ncbi:MAG: NADase-type glycan-binding domain-containing protein [bacterium]
MGKFILSLTNILVLFPFLLLANGGPMDWSSVTGTGNLDFSECEHIILESETLDINIIEDYIQVGVIYNLHNQGKDQQVVYAFPIEYSVYYSTWEEIAADTTHFVLFKIYDDGIELNSERFIGDKPFQIQTPDGNQECYYGWFQSPLTFLQDEKKRVVIQYQCKVLYEDFITSKSFLPSFSNRYIRYNLEPASYWADQPVKIFHFTLHTQDILNRGGSVNAITEGGQWISDSVFTIDWSNVDFHQDSLLEFIYEIRNNKMTEYFQQYQLPPRNLISISASSSLSPQSGINYIPENLVDGLFSTAWVEGIRGQGEGEVIEVELEDFMVGWIGIINGYTKSDQAYQENSRIKSLVMNLYLDEEYSSSRMLSNPIQVELEDIGCSEICDLNFAKYAQPLFSHGMGLPIVRIELEIIDVYPGSKYEDAAVSELIILGFTGDQLIYW